jgi:hypothetical protein
MYLTKRITNLLARTSLLKVIGLVIGFNISACDCSQRGGVKQDGSLVMSISNTKLIGTKRTIEAVLKLSDDSKGALLDNFKLKVSFLKQEGGLGSTIKYNAYADGEDVLKKIRTPLVEESLIHFTKDKELAFGDDPLKVSFSVRPGKGVTSLVAIFTLVDAANQPIGDDIEVTWEEEKQPINLTLERISAEHMKGSNKAIQLKISNYETQQLEMNELKLKAVRTIGTSAIIDGSISITNTNEYEIALGELMNNESIIQDLNIISNQDIKAEYTLQILYKGKLIGNEIKANWEKGIELTLNGIKYDKVTQSIIYTVTNTGSITANNLKIQYTSKTAGIKLGGNYLGNVSRTQNLNTLNPGAILENQVLGKLDFSSNKSADFEFKITCEEGFTLTQRHTFYDEDIDLYIDKLIYDQANGLVIYNVKNKGTAKTTHKVKLKYSNVSEDDNLDGKTVLLENSSSATIDLGEISGNNGEAGDRKLAIDFKYADKASFKFELIYNENILIHETKTEIFKAKPVQLKIVPLTSLRLIGPQRAIRCKIELGTDSRSLKHIDTSKLSLAITNSLKNDAYLSLTPGKAHIDKLTGKDLGALGNEVTLHVNSNGNKEAQFNFHIEYKGKYLITNPLSIDWKEVTLEIIELDDFINDDIATFKLKNLNTLDSIDTESIHIELLSNNEAAFTLLDTNNIPKGNITTLHQLAEHLNLLQPTKATESIRFSLTNANGKKEATITLVAKQGTSELARKVVSWKKEENLITHGFEKPTFENKEVKKITLFNAGPTLDANTTEIQLTNDKNIQFNLNGNIGNKFKINLKDVIGKDNFIKGETTELSLQIADGVHEYSATFTLRILDNNKDTIGGYLLTWTNSQKLIDIKESLNRIRTIIEEISSIQENTYTLEDEDKLTLKIWEESVEKIIDKQIVLKDILENIKDIDSIDNPSRDIQTEKLRNIQEWNEDTERYILNSLIYASNNMEHFAKKIKAEEGSKASRGGMGVILLSSDRIATKAWFMSISKLKKKLSVFQEIKADADKVIEKANEFYKRIQGIMDTPTRGNIEQNKIINTKIPQAELDRISASPHIKTPRRTQGFSHKKNNSNEDPKARRTLFNG